MGPLTTKNHPDPRDWPSKPDGDEKNEEKGKRKEEEEEGGYFRKHTIILLIDKLMGARGGLWELREGSVSMNSAPSGDDWPELGSIRG